jgi:CHASE3 domain sensor protein
METKTNIEKKYFNSLNEYYKLANEIDIYTDNYWDMMTYDIEGYEQIFYEDSYNNEQELKEMKKTIKAYKHLLKSLELIKKNGSRFS